MAMASSRMTGRPHVEPQAFGMVAVAGPTSRDGSARPQRASACANGEREDDAGNPREEQGAQQLARRARLTLSWAPWQHSENDSSGFARL